MIAAMEGAGTRTMKFRGGMGLLGVLGKYGMYRLGNTMAPLDTHVRGVGPEEAKGGRNWSNYTWHGDQAPGPSRSCTACRPRNRTSTICPTRC